MERKKYPVLVTIQCTVYNHEPYLRKCLDGFVMQQTTFPFEAIVHDDASTDNSAEIIREYAEKYPDIIKPIYEEENQYSKKQPGLIGSIMTAAMSPSSKYIAICEGDDYWTDPHKLQMQVSFLESHPDYMMCVTEARVLINEEYFQEWKTFKDNCDISTDRVIFTAGRHLIQTCTFVFKKEVFKDWPDVNNRCCVGDMPLFITCALKGKVYYFSCKTGVYRKSLTNGSWSSRMEKLRIEKKIQIGENIANTLLGLNEYSGGKYQNAFYNAVAYLIYVYSSSAPNYTNKIINSLLPISVRQAVLSTLNRSCKTNLWLWSHHCYIIYKIKHSLGIVVYNIISFITNRK